MQPHVRGAHSPKITAAKVNEYRVYRLEEWNTSLRLDEARRLQFRDVTGTEEEGSGQTILEMEVRKRQRVGYSSSDNR